MGDFRPVNDYLIIRPIEITAPFGLIVTDPKKPEQGEVIHAGQSKEIKVGDKVMFNKNCPEVFGDVLMIKEEFILCVIDEFENAEIKTNRKTNREIYAHDIIQPFDNQGNPNQEFMKQYPNSELCPKK